MTAAAVAQRRPAGTAVTPPDVLGVVLLERRERNPVFRGDCYLCGTAIYPGRFNWYCRTCAALMTARDMR